MISRRILGSIASPTTGGTHTPAHSPGEGVARRDGGGWLQLSALGGEADFGEAQEDEAEDGR